jgi:AcrR family transcriptional regulator
MEAGYKRKKQPELVKSQLIEAAIEISSKIGLSNITVQAVADLAGVTKGGLLHHFPSKQVLIEEVFNILMENLDLEINRIMEKDSEPKGSFSRAYVKSSYSGHENNSIKIWPAFSTSLVLDSEMQKIWYEWLKLRLQKHKKTDSSINCEIARLAADGLWFNLNFVDDSNKNIFNPKLLDTLINLTFE